MALNPDRVDKAPKGLSEDTVRLSSNKKNEPAWMWNGVWTPTGAATMRRSREWPGSNIQIDTESYY